MKLCAAMSYSVKTNPTQMINLCSISLCSVLYKIVFKFLVARLQPLLPAIRSSTQSSFVSERLISKKTLIAHEMAHSLQTHPNMS